MVQFIKDNIFNLLISLIVTFSLTYIPPINKFVTFALKLFSLPLNPDVVNIVLRIIVAIFLYGVFWVILKLISKVLIKDENFIKNVAEEVNNQYNTGLANIYKKEYIDFLSENIEDTDKKSFFLKAVIDNPTDILERDDLDLTFIKNSSLPEFKNMLINKPKEEKYIAVLQILGQSLPWFKHTEKSKIMKTEMINGATGEQKDKYEDDVYLALDEVIQKYNIHRTEVNKLLKRIVEKIGKQEISYNTVQFLMSLDDKGLSILKRQFSYVLNIFTLEDNNYFIFPELLKNKAKEQDLFTNDSKFFLKHSAILWLGSSSFAGIGKSLTIKSLKKDSSPRFLVGNRKIGVGFRILEYIEEAKFDVNINLVLSDIGIELYNLLKEDLEFGNQDWYAEALRDYLANEYSIKIYIDNKSIELELLNYNPERGKHEVVNNNNNNSSSSTIGSTTNTNINISNIPQIPKTNQPKT